MARSAVTIHFKNLERVQRRLKALHPKVYAPAMSSTLNKTTTATKAVAARELKAEMGLSRISRIKQEIKTWRATTKRLSAGLYARTGRLGLIHFGARQLKKGVRHKAWNKRQLLEGAFIAKVKPGAGYGDDTVKQVFWRKTKKRLPLRKIWGPGIAKTMGEEKVMGAMKKTIKEKLWPTLKREIRWRASRK